MKRSPSAKSSISNVDVTAEKVSLNVNGESLTIVKVLDGINYVWRIQFPDRKLSSGAFANPERAIRWIASGQAVRRSDEDAPQPTPGSGIAQVFKPRPAGFDNKDSEPDPKWLLIKQEPRTQPAWGGLVGHSRTAHPFQREPAAAAGPTGEAVAHARSAGKIKGYQKSAAMRSVIVGAGISVPVTGTTPVYKSPEPSGNWLRLAEDQAAYGAPSAETKAVRVAALDVIQRIGCNQLDCSDLLKAEMQSEIVAQVTAIMKLAQANLGGLAGPVSDVPNIVAIVIKQIMDGTIKVPEDRAAAKEPVER